MRERVFKTLVICELILFYWSVSKDKTKIFHAPFSPLNCSRGIFPHFLCTYGKWDYRHEQLHPHHPHHHHTILCRLLAAHLDTENYEEVQNGRVFKHKQTLPGLRTKTSSNVQGLVKDIWILLLFFILLIRWPCLVIFNEMHLWH